MIPESLILCEDPLIPHPPFCAQQVQQTYKDAIRPAHDSQIEQKLFAALLERFNKRYLCFCGLQTCFAGQLQRQCV